MANVSGGTTATDLGIAGNGVANTLTGTVINTIGSATALASLNDGNGVLVRDHVNDLRITARDGTVIDVDFGRKNAPITNATLLADLNNGTGVKIMNRAAEIEGLLFAWLNETYFLKPGEQNQAEIQTGDTSKITTTGTRYGEKPATTPAPAAPATPLDLGD